MKRDILLIFPLALTSIAGWAQTPWFKAAVEFRSDYAVKSVTGMDTDKGFRARYLNVKLSGDIAPGFSYNYRQRLSKDIKSAGGFLDATDYIYLDYRPDDRWTLSAGKQFVAIGGFEYDYAPIDVYRYSEYCDNIECYGYGISAAYHVTSRDQILIQAAQSAFAGHSVDRYSYNLLWRGTHGRFSSISSIGLHEYDRARYILCTALSGRFDLGFGHVFVDYTNRYDTHPSAVCGFFDDYTLAAECHLRPIRHLNVFGRYVLDHNGASVSGDPTLRPDTHLHTLGIGLEYFPLNGDPDVRLHAAFFHTAGRNSSPAAVNLPDTDYLTLGLTWRANFEKIAARMRKP